MNEATVENKKELYLYMTDYKYTDKTIMSSNLKKHLII